MRRRPIVTLPLTLVGISTTSLIRLTRGTKNFCGTTWNDASLNCDNRQPCELGTDEECTAGKSDCLVHLHSVVGIYAENPRYDLNVVRNYPLVWNEKISPTHTQQRHTKITGHGKCWGDTNCDTSLGHGILFMRDHPSHSRFCGDSWEDADTKCTIERHCPNGTSAECSDGQTCYMFLSACNYIDMIGGYPIATVGASSTTLPKDDPTRSNYCGIDWNDAIGGCADDENWCPSGADADCPEGKICFAGTECLYVSDLVPTASPSDGPTVVPTPMAPPTQAPLAYADTENTRFCGLGWEDVRTTCRIGSHCPSGDSSECPPGQECIAWIQGCNVVDFEQHLMETGQEIFGADHWLMPPEGLPGVVDVTAGANSTNSEPQLPPSEVLSPSSLNVQSTSPSSLNTSPATSPKTSQPPGMYGLGQNNVFCGTSWHDASERCSPETFCSDGASLHKCVNATDICWAGVTACDANEWVPTTSPSIVGTFVPSGKLTSLSTWDVSHTASSDLTFSTEEEALYDEEEEESASTSMRQSYCATDYNHVMSSCAILDTCNEEPCPDGYTCFTNVKCDVEEMTGPVPSPVPLSSTRTPIGTEPITTNSPTLFTISAEELTQRLTTANSYCASSLSEVLSSCSYALHTCNDEDSMCGAGTSCFEDILCPDPNAKTTAPAFITSSPSSSIPSSIAPTASNSGIDQDNDSAVTPQNYCATSQDQLPLICTTAPTCNDGDEPCPSGTFCYGDHICSDISSSIPTSIAPTASNSGIGQDYDSAVTPQNYCATSQDELLLACTTAPTCNDGDEPCPSGTFCYGDHVCDESTAIESFASAPPTTSRLTSEPSSTSTLESSSSSPTTLRPTLRPTSISTLAAGSLISFNDGIDGNVQNYCAKSKEDLRATCAIAQTCNDPGQTCPAGTFCFGNHACQANANAMSEASTSIPTHPPELAIDIDDMASSPEYSETTDSVWTTSVNATKPWEIDDEDSEPNEYPWQVSADDNGDREAGTDMSYPYWLEAEGMNSARGRAGSSIIPSLVLIISLANWMCVHGG